MKVESKFNIGDDIYFLAGELPMKSKIAGISFFIGEKHSHSGQSLVCKKCSVSYNFHDVTVCINETDAYETKEQLIDAYLSKFISAFADEKK
ncbi:MAG: hypothetical protein AABY22_03370 [Nanoarchaeota archaeon]